MINDMKITLLVRYFTIGGLERVVSALANSYVDRKIETQIIVLSKGKRNSLITELDPRIKVVFLESNIFTKLSEIRQRTKDNIVHIHFGDGKIHPMIRTALLGRKVVVTCHSVYSHKRTKILNMIDLLFSKAVKKIIAVSDAVEDFCTNEVHISSDKVVVIKNGIECEEEQIKISNKEKTLKIISLASLYPHKNQMYLMEALADFKRKTGIPFKLYVIGDGPCMADIYLRSIELGLRDNVVWYGAIWQKDLVRNIIKSSDVFVSASKYEGFPISILEGMVYGMPLILSDIPPHREIAGVEAMFFKLDDNHNQFIKCIEKFYKDFSVRNKMSDYSYSRVNKFTIDKTVDAYINVYKNM